MSILYQAPFVDLTTRQVSVSYVEIHLLFHVIDMWFDLLCIDVFIIPLVVQVDFPFQETISVLCYLVLFLICMLCVWGGDHYTSLHDCGKYP